MNVDIMKDASEIVHYDTPGLPLYIREGFLSSYSNFRALCHWHEDVEFIHIFSGEMMYYINGKHVLIKQNDGILITPRQMHYGYSDTRTECNFSCLLIHPSAFCDNSKLYEMYIEPVVEQSTIEFYYLSSEHPEEAKILNYLDQMFHLKYSGQSGYELEVIGLFHMLWAVFFRLISKDFSVVSECSHVDITCQRKMVSFIYQNYARKITLDEISAAGGVCRSKCCQIFKEYLEHTPIEFVNIYRLEVSSYLLKNTDHSVTDIALSCGFNHISHYSEVFRNYYGCTPKQYRLKCHDEMSNISRSSDSPGI